MCLCPADTADILKPTAEKAERTPGKFIKASAFPAAESAETQTPPPRLPAKAGKN